MRVVRKRPCQPGPPEPAIAAPDARKIIPTRIPSTAGNVIGTGNRWGTASHCKSTVTPARVPSARASDIERRTSPLGLGVPTIGERYFDWTLAGGAGAGAGLTGRADALPWPFFTLCPALVAPTA